MNTRPLISVIIPTFNRKNVICRAIDSVLKQTYNNYEILVIDDGSYDGTKELLYNTYGDKIRYYYKENEGQNSALNWGINNANGDVIAFLDSDDEWLETKLEKTVMKFESDSEIKVVYNWTGFQKNTGEIILAREDRVEGYCYAEALRQGYITSPSFLCVRKECFNVIGPLDEKFVNCQDDDLCFLLAKKYKVGLIPEILGIYHNDGLGQITQKKDVVADGWERLWRKYKEDVVRLCGLEEYGNKLYNTSICYIYAFRFDDALKIYSEAKKCNLKIKYQIIWNCVLCEYILKYRMKEARRQLSVFGTGGFFKHYLYRISRLFSSGDYYRKVYCNNRLVLLRTNSSDEYLWGSIVWGTLYNGEFISDYCQAINYIKTKNRPVVIDAGANIGLFSIAVKNSVQNATLYLIEPDSENFELATYNTKRYNGIKCIKAGLWSHKCRLSIVPSEQPWGIRVQEDDLVGENGIDAISIQDLCDEYDIEKIDLVKMDVEGAEDVIFSENIMWIDRTSAIVMEVHEEIAPGVSERIDRIMTEKGFLSSKFGENIFYFRSNA